MLLDLGWYLDDLKSFLLEFWFLDALIIISCAAVTAVIAGKKNRNAVGWFLLGAAFGFLGVTLAIVIPEI